MYTKMEVRELIHNLLNERDRPIFGENIWEVEDVDEILLWLEKENYIRNCLWPWFMRIDCRGKGKRFKPSEARDKTFRKEIRISSALKSTRDKALDIPGKIAHSVLRRFSA